MSDRRADIQVGLFSIIGLLLLAMLILVFGGFKNVLVETYDVTAIFENAAGTTEGTPVRLVGIEVGSVKSIWLDGETGGVRMRLTIDRNVDIRQGAPIAIKQEGFIANMYLEFGLGDSPDILAKDGTAEVSGTIDTFAAYIERATVVIADMGRTIKDRMGNLSDALLTLTENFNNIVGDEEFQDDVKVLTANARTLSATLREKLPPMMDNISALAAKAQTSIDKTAGLLDTWQGLGEDLRELSGSAGVQLDRQGANLDKLTASLTESADSVATLATSLNDVVEMVKAGEGTMGKLFSDTELYRSLVDSIDEIEDTARMIGELAEILKRHPDWVLTGPPKDRR